MATDVQRAYRAVRDLEDLGRDRLPGGDRWLDFLSELAEDYVQPLLTQAHQDGQLVWRWESDSLRQAHTELADGGEAYVQRDVDDARWILEFDTRVASRTLAEVADDDLVAACRAAEVELRQMGA